MLSALTLDDATGTPVTLNDELGRVSANNVTGLVGFTSLRESRRPRPQAHGGIDESKYGDGQLMSMDMNVSGPSMELAYAAFRTIEAACIQTLDIGPALLKWTEGVTGNQLQRYVKLAGDIDPPITESASVLAFNVQFFAEDPRAYAQTLTSVPGATLSTASGGLTIPRTFPITFSPSGGGLVTFTNTGTRPTPLITYRIDGQVTNPTIALLGSDSRIVLNGTVAAGDYLEVDAAKRTVKINGDVSRQNFLDSANTTWVEAPVGNSTWQLIAGSFDSAAMLTLTGRSAF